MSRKKKKEKKKKNEEEVVYDNKHPERYTIEQLENMLDVIPGVVEKLKQEIQSRESEIGLYDNDSDKLRVSEALVGLYRDKCDLLLNFAHISLDLGKKHRERYESQVGEEVKKIEIKLRSQLEKKFDNLKVRLKDGTEDAIPAKEKK